MQSEGKLPEGTPKRYPSATKAYGIIVKCACLHVTHVQWPMSETLCSVPPASQDALSPDSAFVTSSRQCGDVVCLP